MTKQEIKKKIDSLTDLPTLPDIIFKSNQLFEDPDVLLADVTKLIETDQSIASKILLVVNSAFYGFPGKINTISQAIIILGFNSIRNIMLSVSVFNAFPKSEHFNFFNLQEFWKHSIGCGAIAKFLGMQIKLPLAEEAFVAGLLHDLGKIVLVQYFPNEFIEALKLVFEKNILLLEAEEEILGVNHMVIGNLLARSWALPPNLIEVLSFHHNPSQSKLEPELTSIVHLSDIICRGIGIGSGGDNSIPEIEDFAWKLLNFKVEMIEEWLPEVSEIARLAYDFFLGYE